MAQSRTTMVTRRSARNLQGLVGVENPARRQGHDIGTESILSPVRNPVCSIGTESANTPFSNPDTLSLNPIENVSSPESESDLNQRDYTLNMDKAWKKKLEACNADFKVRSVFKGGNYVFNFSTAMYELYREALVKHFETIMDETDACIRVRYKDCLDNSGATVESQLKVYQSSTDKLKYSINLYHTKSKVMVNGKEAYRFNSEHVKISDIILSGEDVSGLDKEYADTILEGLRAIRVSKSTPETNQNSSNTLITNTSPQLLTEQSHVQGDSPILVNTSGYGDSNELNGDPSPCPSCTNLVDIGGIFCDGCENWFHFECETLTAEDVRRYDGSDDPY
ncbi:MAG: hypothetical protein AB2693_22650 [Candidatus Thiodiazotropha sp.]